MNQNIFSVELSTDKEHIDNNGVLAKIFNNTPKKEVVLLRCDTLEDALSKVIKLLSESENNQVQQITITNRGGLLVV